jgi:Rrf2 family protein
VKLSVKSDYAARAVLSLARRYQSGKSIRAEEIATENGIPPNYLTQILIELKAQEIVKSTRGKAGGYLLARPPAAISLGDVLHSVYGPLLDTPAFTDPLCPSELKHAWRGLQKTVEGAAGSLNFQQLVESGGERDRMFYI